jgi:hypothetical protein
MNIKGEKMLTIRYIIFLSIRFIDKNLLASFMNNSENYGLFTSRYRCKGEAVAPEDVVHYLEGATTKAL